MSVMGNIMSAIFRHSTTAAQMASTAPNSPPPPILAGQKTGGIVAPSTVEQASVDVEAVLTKLASQNKEKLDWRRSVVDLMKLLNLDSSLSARKELAKELHYSGNTKDYAAMNVWLHKEVITSVLRKYRIRSEPELGDLRKRLLAAEP